MLVLPSRRHGRRQLKIEREAGWPERVVGAVRIYTWKWEGSRPSPRYTRSRVCDAGVATLGLISPVISPERCANPAPSPIHTDTHPHIHPNPPPPPRALSPPPHPPIALPALPCAQSGPPKHEHSRRPPRPPPQGDDLCHCVSADSSSSTISSACRAKLRPGSSCRVPLRAAAGTSFAGGILDEFYSYTATGYTRGGLCRVGALHRDTLLAVYAACGRTGAQEPLGFSNSETHTVSADPLSCATPPEPCYPGRPPPPVSESGRRASSAPAASSVAATRQPRVRRVLCNSRTGQSLETCNAQKRAIPRTVQPPQPVRPHPRLDPSGKVWGCAARRIRFYFQTTNTTHPPTAQTHRGFSPLPRAILTSPTRPLPLALLYTPTPPTRPRPPPHTHTRTHQSFPPLAPHPQAQTEFPCSPTGSDRVPVLTHRPRPSSRAHPQAQTEFPCSPTGPDRVPVLTHRLRLSFRAHPQAQTEFPCQAGTTYHIFWNAEYLPGRHGFTIDERCGSAAPAGCERAPPAAGGGGRMATGRELGHSGRDIGRMAMRRANARRG
eukprot:scaffold21517_cov99-Isochrysis_galbana.AAC.2